MLIDQEEFNALREIVRDNTGNEMILLNRFTARGMRHALGLEQEAGLQRLLQRGVIVEAAGRYEFAPEIQRALVREELGESLQVAESITRLQMGKQAPRLETPDMHKGVYRGEILGSSKWHVVQRLENSQTVVAHLKNQLNSQLKGQEVFGRVEITYSQGKGIFRELEQERKRRKELALGS
jgi:hypothetical protein